MQLLRSLALGLLPLVLLTNACGTESRKSKAPDTQATTPVSPVSPVGPVAPTQQPTKTCTGGQILDADNVTCRKPTERDCLEQNKVLYGERCDANFQNLSADSANAPKINFSSYCEKNPAGAFVNCKDGEFLLPVAAIAHVEGTPEAFKTLAVDQEIKLLHAIKSVGDVKLTLEIGAETVDLLKPTDSTKPWLIRNLKVGDSIAMKLTFAPETVIHGLSEIRIAEQFVSYHDKNQILDGIASKSINSKWLSEETVRQRRTRSSGSSLNAEWNAFLKKDVKGDLVWTLNETCPADQQSISFSGTTCLVDQKIESKLNPKWQNKAFIYTCYTNRTITIEYQEERYGLLSYGKFQDKEFTITVPKNTPFIGSAGCFIKIVE